MSIGNLDYETSNSFKWIGRTSKPLTYPNSMTRAARRSSQSKSSSSSIRTVSALRGVQQKLANMLLGFFYVIGHGFTDDEVRHQYALAKAVFELPLEEKLKYICDTAKGDFRGYKPQSTGKLASRDNDERYNIPKFTSEHERPHPQIINDHIEEIRNFSLVKIKSINQSGDANARSENPQRPTPSSAPPVRVRPRSRRRVLRATPSL